MEQTREPQYQRCLELRESRGLERLGLMSSQTWHDDPKRLVFLLARYKFVAKMLSGKTKVLEVGCGDAFGTRIVQQEVGELVAVDFDPVFIADAQARLRGSWHVELRVHDILQGPVAGGYDGAYALDVLEHIPPADERRFVQNLADSCIPQSVVVVGTPSRIAEAHASAQSREGHVNLKDAPSLRALLLDYFHHVFVFSMNDEVVHTGYYPMAHYYLALCCSRREFHGV